jgi:hypothetical protein
MAEQSGEVGSSAGHAALTEVGSVGSEANLVAPVVSAESASSASESAPLEETATLRTPVLYHNLGRRPGASCRSEASASLRV